MVGALCPVGLRHLAFMALMRLGGLAPTLFREEEEFAVAGEHSSLCACHFLVLLARECLSLGGSSSRCRGYQVSVFPRSPLGRASLCPSCH